MLKGYLITRISRHRDYSLYRSYLINISYTNLSTVTSALPLSNLARITVFVHIQPSVHMFSPKPHGAVRVDFYQNVNHWIAANENAYLRERRADFLIIQIAILEYPPYWASMIMVRMFIFQNPIVFCYANLVSSLANIQAKSATISTGCFIYPLHAFPM